MSFLQNYLSEYNLDSLYTIYDEELINSVEEKNFLKIVQYLIKNNIDFLEDIICSYLDLFLIEYDVFVEKFEGLKVKYGNDISDKISYNMQILEEMLD